MTLVVKVRLWSVGRAMGVCILFCVLERDRCDSRIAGLLQKARMIIIDYLPWLCMHKVCLCK